MSLYPCHCNLQLGYLSTSGSCFLSVHEFFQTAFLLLAVLIFLIASNILTSIVLDSI